MAGTFILLDRKIANEFHICAQRTKEYPCCYGEMQQLRNDLQKLCGITEIEALNVLTNRNVQDYIAKYSGSVMYGNAIEQRDMKLNSIYLCQNKEQA